jgi:hypothetical protein
MSSALDMNSNAINNLPDAVNSQSPVTLSQAASIQAITGIVATQGAVGEVLWPITAAETSAGVTPTNYYYEPGNVLRYGSNTTPGTTNMTTPIANALSVGATHPTYIPPGTYKTTSILAPVSDSKTFCDGKIQHTSATAVSFSSVDRAEWYGGSFEGDNTTDTQNALRIQSGNDCVIDVYKIDKCLNKGIDISGTSDGNYIRCRQVSGCTGTSGVGISCFGTAVTNVTVGPSNCNNNRIGMTFNGTDGFTVVAPNCSNNTAGGLFFDGVITKGSDGPRNGVVTGAICNNNGGTSYGGIYYGNGCHNIRVIGAVCNGNTGGGIRSSGGHGYEAYNMSFISPTCNSNGISGINLSNSDTTAIVNPDIRHNTGRGIYLLSSDRCTISGGHIYGNTQEGIYLQCDYARVHDVMSIGNTHGIRLEYGGSTGANNKLYNNILVGPVDTFVDGDVTPGTDLITLTGNDFVTEDPVQLTTTGTLPAGLATGTTYYVKKVADDADDISLYSDSALTSIVDITAAAGGGTHTISTANTTAALVDTPAGAYIKNNTGYITENTGSGSITSGGTTDVIVHGLSETPIASNIHITLTENPTNSPGAIWIDTIGASNFTVNCENDPGASDLDFSWKITS